MTTTNEGRVENGAVRILKGIKSHRLMLALTCINLAVAATVVFRSGFERPIEASSQQVPGVVRAQAIELVSEQGQVRSRLNVEPGGEVVFRLIDKNGTIRVKLGASEDGSGLLLLDEATEPAVHMIARRAATSAKPTTTSIILKGRDGQQQVIKP